MKGFPATLLIPQGKESVKEDGYEENPPVITVVPVEFLVPVIIVKFLNEGSQHASA